MSATSMAIRTLDTQPLRSLLRTFGRWRGTLVLVYHRIGDATASPLHRDLFSATAEGFAAQLDVLEREAEVVDAADAIGRRTGSGRRVAITFDDGYRDTATVAWPLLAARGLPATVFLSSGYLDEPRLAWWDELAWIAGTAGWSPTVVRALCNRYAGLPTPQADDFLAAVAAAARCGRAPADAATDLWMDWDDARRMRDEGATIGGHTVTHPVLSRVDAARLEQEIEGCRAALADRLGVAMDLFSYPLGGPHDVDTRAYDPLERAGVRLAFACAGGVARPHHRASLRVPRACAPTADANVAARCRAAVGLPMVFARC